MVASAHARLFPLVITVGNTFPPLITVGKNKGSSFFSKKHVTSEISSMGHRAVPKLTCNLGQKVGGKFTKLTQISFFRECFTADFLHFLAKSVKFWLLGGRLGTLHQIQALQGFS